MYAKSYLGIGNIDKRYGIVDPDAAGWVNVLLLCKLIFSLPFSNS